MQFFYYLCTMLKGKDIFTFVRFGGLDLKNQKGFSKDDDSYHSPPTTRGFYAMPKIAQEFFLIGCLDKTQPGIFSKNSKLKDEWKIKLSQIRKEFRKTNGEIWHHLGEYTKHKDILDRKGSWIKTDIKVWEKSFSKMCTILRGRNKYDLESGNTKVYPNRGLMGNFSKDHCEVFFDEKV